MLIKIEGEEEKKRLAIIIKTSQYLFCYVLII